MKNIKKILKYLFIIGFILGFLGVLSLVGIFYYYGQDVYNEKELKSFNPTTALKIYDRNDKLIALFYKRDSKKTVIPANKIPKLIIDSFVAVEDKRFFEHSGLDYKGILRAIVIDILTMSKKEGAYKSVLFTQKKVPEMELWTGTRLGVDAAQERFDVDEVFCSDEY